LASNAGAARGADPDPLRPHGGESVRDLKRLAASLFVACQDAGLSDSAAESVAVAGARSYRLPMAEMATMTPLEVWYDRIELVQLIEDAPDKATRARRKKMQRKAHKRVADNLFPS
jgi:hypothetical protein